MTEARSSRGGSLELQGLGKSYGVARALDAMSLAIRPGEFVTLLGPSGSGKTTTLMMIAGFTPADAGRILLDGRDITSLPAHRREIGVVFQSYALFPHLTVAENVAFSLRMRDVPSPEIADRVDRALTLVQLQDYGDRYPRQLSGGQQQRVALARALVFEPALLLLDEPLGALDRLLREHMKLELRRIHRELGTTMLYVTHDQDEALVLSDRVVVMNDGRVEQVGTPEDIYERPANRFVAGFIGESNFLRGVVRSCDERAAVIEIGRLTLRGRPASALAPAAPADLAVRPEKIVMAPAAPGAPSAMIEDRIYSGDSIRYVVRMGGSQVTVKTTIRAGLSLHKPGDHVALSWSDDDAIVFPAR